jgi:hypothetical protein
VLFCLFGLPNHSKIFVILIIPVCFDGFMYVLPGTRRGIVYRKMTINPLNAEVTFKNRASYI